MGVPMETDVLGLAYSEGEVLFNEGDTGDCMYVIQLGKVRISKNTPTGEVVLADLGQGEIFGEMALFDKLPRSATATALEESRILSVDRKKFFSSVSRDPTLSFKILQSMSERTRKINNEFTRLKKKKFDLIYACMDVDQTCNVILEEAREVISAENGSIMILDKTADHLEIKAAFGEESMEKVLLKLGDGIAGRVMETGISELVNEAQSAPGFKSGELKIGSLICVPLNAQGFNFGVITLSSSMENAFNEEHLQILGIISFYASIAIQNAFSCSELHGATEEVLNLAAHFGV
ncbi:cyclic nucleotide-binding domain-containing protein [bacterium]|nr:MAG: cyclic nucleotide-binding domain-containing protein [bacterium]